MSLDLWFKADLERILLSKEQAALRDRHGVRLVSYLDAINDLRVEFGIPQRADYPMAVLVESDRSSARFFPASQLYLPPNHQGEEETRHSIALQPVDVCG